MAGEVLVSAPDGAGVVTVRLHHAGRLNAMTRAMWRALRAAFDPLAHEPAVRCVVVEGEGGAFCAGGDISEYPGFRFDAAQLRDFHENDVWGALAAMLACDVPLVAALAGPCMGAGVEIASCCDIRIAADDARFGAPIAKLGFPMAPREAQLVAGAVGEGVARQMLLEAATFSAAQMHAQGFVSRVVAPNALAGEVARSAQRIAALAPQAARLNKRTFRALKQVQTHAGKSFIATENIVNGTDDPYAYADSVEHREGIGAFLAKRPPVF